MNQLSNLENREIETQNIDLIRSVVSREGFDICQQDCKMELAEKLGVRPQEECTVIHRFGPGIYIREAHYPAKVFMVGMFHTTAHYNQMLSGSMGVIDSNGEITYITAPLYFTAPPGSKVGFTIEPVVWQNIFATNETDVEKLEEMFMTSPEFLDKRLNEKLDKNRLDHDDDRDDFEQALNEGGWDKSKVDALVSFEGDRIPFPYGSYAVVKSDSPIHGKGLFASGPFYSGQGIAPMNIEGKRTPAGYLVNHSKTPNAIMERWNDGNLYLVALKDISGTMGAEPGEEITLDYRQAMKTNGLWKGLTCLAQSL